MDKERKNKKEYSFLSYWPNIVLSILSLGFLVWFFLIMRQQPNGDAIDTRPSWLILPLTGIYVLSNFWVVLFTNRSAAAAVRSVAVMSATLEEMRRSTKAQYNPILYMPHDPRVWVKQDNSVDVKTANSTDHPAIDVIYYLWEIEEDSKRNCVCNYNTIRVSRELVVLGKCPERNVHLELMRGSVEDKVSAGKLIMAHFIATKKREPKRNACIALFESPIESLCYAWDNMEVIGGQLLV